MKVGFKEVGFDSIDWMKLAQDRVLLEAVVPW
jgi:hypothetical protein